MRDFIFLQFLLNFSIQALTFNPVEANVFPALPIVSVRSHMPGKDAEKLQKK